MPSRSLIAVRYVLPAVIVVAGVAAIAIGSSSAATAGGLALVGAGLSVALLNLLFRVGVKGDEERDREQAARDYFDRHGHWPDETPARSDPAGDEPAPGLSPP